MPAVFDNHWVKKLHGTHVKKGKTLMDQADALRDDIRTFKSEKNATASSWSGAPRPRSS